MVRGRWTARACLAIGFAIALSRTEASPAPKTAKYVVVIVIDACRPDYLDLATLPRLDELRRRGTTFHRAWVGQVVNNTPPSHATIATGCFPKRHGIVSFFWKDPTTGRIAYPTSLGPVTDGKLGDLIVESKVPTLLGLLRKKSIRPVRAYAISSSKYYAAAAMGGLEADTILFAAPSGDVASLGPDSVEEGPGNVGVQPATVTGHSASPKLLADPELNRAAIGERGQVNGWAITAALKLIEREPCDVLYLNLPETDEVGHSTGASREAIKPVLQALDEQIGRLVDAYKVSGRFDETLFVVTSDHGMIPNRTVVELPTMQALEATLKPDEKIDLLPRLRPGFVVARPPFLWVKNTEDAGVFAEALARTKSPGVRGVFFKKRNENGSFEYAPAPTTIRALGAELIETYRYLLSTMACANGPDVALATEEGALFGGGKPGTHGGHSTITWESQHIPLWISGPGVKVGATSTAPARLADVAPTLARLLGVDPTAMDGIVLTDALESPTPADEARFRWVTKEIAPYEDALRRESR